MNDLLLRRRIAAINSTPSLPYDAEIEYLEGSGTQWIDTGYVPSVPIIERYTAICSVPPLDNDWQGWFGSSNNNEDRTVFFRQRTSVNSLQVYVPKSDANYYAYDAFNLQAGDIITIRIAPFYGVTGEICYLTINGTGQFIANVAKHNESSYVRAYTLKLFTNQRDPYNSTRSPCRMRFYAFNIQNYSTNEDVMDLIPVRVGTTGYMYDKVSGTLFGNSGTGNFILGNDKT